MALAIIQETVNISFASFVLIRVSYNNVSSYIYSEFLITQTIIKLKGILSSFCIWPMFHQELKEIHSDIGMHDNLTQQQSTISFLWNHFSFGTIIMSWTSHS